MIADKQKTTEMNPSDVAEFKGYTIDELRYQRALVMFKKEFCKEKLSDSLNNLKTLSPLKHSNGNNGRLFSKSGIISKIFKSLDYVDYAMMGYSIFKSIKKFSSKFKNKS